MDSKSRYTSVAAIKQVTNLIHDMADDDVYTRATELIHELLSTHLTMVVTLDYLNRCNKIKALSSDEPTNYDFLLDDIQLLVAKHINNNSRKDYLVPHKLSSQFPDCGYFIDHNIEGYVGSVILTEKGEVLGVLISLTDEVILNTDEILDWHHFAVQLIIKHAFYLRCLSKTEGLFEKLSYEVSHDNLTGLLNRSYLSDTLERLLSTPQNPRSFSLILIDIDNFKTINDVYGDYIGDQVLRYVSTCLQKTILDKNLIFRIAADEFAFIVFDVDPTEVSSRILSNISQGYRNDNIYIKLSACAGITTSANSKNGIEIEQIMLNASLALKDSKNTPGKQISCFNQEIYEQYYRRTQLVEALKNELHKTTLNSNLYVVLQPIVHKNHNEWNKFEVLTRWNSSSLGLISPVEFIPVAEQAGLMVDLGKQILQKTCEAKYLIEQRLGKTIHLSINCSAEELNLAENYAKELANVIQSWGFSPQDFTLEITETALLAQDPSINNVLLYLKDLGFRISLDDFGTGYSSLNYIHTYPVDCIKIDASFVSNMLKNPTSEKIVRLIIQLAEQLDYDLIAEGIEDKEVLEKLYSMGCYWIQGFYFSKPMTPIELIEKLQKNHL